MKFTCYLATILLITWHPVFAQDNEDHIIVLPIKATMPADVIKKGSIKAGNNATKTHCDYEEVVIQAKQQAKQMGGNIIKITALIPPAFISKCYRIKADVYYSKELPDSLYNRKPILSDKLYAAVNYAMLYIYRLKDTIMPAPAYNIHLNDDPVLCTVKSRSHDSVKIYREGPLTLWAKTDEREELKLDVRLGTTYYIRCGLKNGQFRKSPVMEIVDNKTGVIEFEKLKRGKKDQSVRYLEEVH